MTQKALKNKSIKWFVGKSFVWTQDYADEHGFDIFKADYIDRNGGCDNLDEPVLIDRKTGRYITLEYAKENLLNITAIFIMIEETEEMDHKRDHESDKIAIMQEFHNNETS